MRQTLQGTMLQTFNLRRQKVAPPSGVLRQHHLEMILRVVNNQHVLLRAGASDSIAGSLN